MITTLKVMRQILVRRGMSTEVKEEEPQGSTFEKWAKEETQTKGS